MNVELTLLNFDWTYEDINNKLSIHCWAIDRENNNVLIRIEDYMNYFYLEIPNSIKWSDNKISSLKNQIIERLQEYAPKEIRLVQRKKLYTHTGAQCYMLALFFDSMDSMRKASQQLSFSCWYKDIGELSFKIHEDIINPIRKLLTQRKIKYSSWFTCIGKEPLTKISILEKEYIVAYKDMNPVESAISKSWIVHPKFLSFDIECNSENINKFPNSKLTNDCSFIITCTFQKFLKPETIKNWAITFCDYEENEIKDAKVIKVKDELEMIRTFEKLIVETDPDIITGYNIIGFDFPYLNNRLRRIREEWNNTSRLKKGKTTLKDVNWSSSGAGSNKGLIMKSPGRICIDFHKLIKRDYKFNNYKLDTVALAFVGETKNDVKPKEMFIAYQTKNKKEMTRILNYGIQDSKLVIKISEKILSWFGLVELSVAAGVPIVDLYSRGMQIRCMSQIFDRCYHNGFAITKKLSNFNSYKGAFVNEPIKGIDDFVATLDFNSLYPNLIRAYNICYTTLISPTEAVKMPPSKYNKIVCEEEINGKIFKFEHYFLVEPKGLLPSIVEDLLTARSQAKKDMEKETDQVLKSVYDKKQLALKVCANSIYGFLGVSEGGLPLIEGARSITSMGRHHIQEVNDILSKEYSAIIVYNDTDSVMYKLPNVTNYDDGYIEYMKMEKILNSRMKAPLRLETEKIGKMLRLKKKKYLYRYWIHPGKRIDTKTGKRFADDLGMEIDGNGNVTSHATGVILARRDGCEFQRNTYRELSRLILTDTEIEKSYECVLNSALQLMTLKQEDAWKKLISVREVKTGYKSETFYMKLFTDRLREMGKPKAVGERVEFLVKDIDEHYAGNKLVLVEDYVDSFEGDTIKLDYAYYVSKYLANSVDQLFEVGYLEQLKEIENKHREKDYISFYEKCAHNDKFRAIIESILNKSNDCEKARQDILNSSIGHYDIVKESNQQYILHKFRFIRYKQYKNGSYGKQISIKTNYLPTRLSRTPVADFLELIKAKKEFVNEIPKVLFKAFF